MKEMNVQKEQKGGRQVSSSLPASLTVEGGYIEGIFGGTQHRESVKTGDFYKVHIVEGKGIGADRDTGKPMNLAEGRYAVFGVTRLDRLMREISRGQRVRITYKGMEPNEKTDNNPEGEGEHHSFDVVVFD